jgi:hypothetical protein
MRSERTLGRSIRDIQVLLESFICIRKARRQSGPMFAAASPSRDDAVTSIAGVAAFAS